MTAAELPDAFIEGLNGVARQLQNGPTIYSRNPGLKFVMQSQQHFWPPSRVEISARAEICHVMRPYEGFGRLHTFTCTFVK